MIKHFVEFMSPGTFVTEGTVREIEYWSTSLAIEMAKDIRERHGARPFGFRFFTKERKSDDLDSKVTESSSTYWLGGTVRTRQQVIDDNLDDEDILRSNMINNDIEKIIVNNNSYKFTAEFKEGDHLLAYDANA